MPVELGAGHAADLALEGAALDDAATRAEVLLADVFADSAYELLPDWERVLGLVPGEDVSVTARVAACVAKIRARGGLSIAYFEALAEAMGYDVTILEYEPFMAGVGMAGYPVYVAEVVFCWRVDVADADPPTWTYDAGESGAGDPLQSFGVLDLEEVFEDLKPAHSFVHFTYP